MVLLQHYVFPRLYNYIRVEDLMRQRNGVWFFRDRKLTQKQIHAIKEAATSLDKSDVLKMLFQEMEYKAHQKMFHESTNGIDLLFSRAMLYNIDIMKQKIKNLSEIDLRK